MQVSKLCTDLAWRANVIIPNEITLGIYANFQAIPSQFYLTVPESISTSYDWIMRQMCYIDKIQF